MVPFKAIFKEEVISFSVPQSYNELTLRQLIALNKWDKKDIVAMISILCNVDYDVLFNSRCADIDQQIFPLLSWANQTHDFKHLILPKQITIGEKKYDVPNDISVKTLGQKISLQLYLARAYEEGLSNVECIPFALAIYFQPEVTGEKFDEDKAKQLIPIMEQCKMMEAYPVGDFFLRQFIKSLTRKTSACPRCGLWRRTKLAFPN